MTATTTTTLAPLASASTPIVNQNKKLGPLVILWKYFESRTEDQTREQFVRELKDLSPTEKLELATLAADAMGIPNTDRDFSRLEAEVSEK